MTRTAFVHERCTADAVRGVRRGRPHAISLLGATLLVVVDAVTTAWLAAIGS